MSRLKQSLEPVVRPDTRLLVLGSLPGETSLAAGRYYAHPQNRFWQLMERVIDAPLVPLAYDERLETLLAHHVGLWDSVQSARREGSLDSALREVEATDLPSMVARLPQLRAVAFNGKTSEKHGRPQLAASHVELVALPSSSPANAAMTFAEKAQAWDKLRQFIV